MTVTAANITAMGFTAPMFGITDVELATRIASAITEQSDLIADRVGATAFALAANTKALDRAIKCLTAVEMARSRITQLSGNTVLDAAESAELAALESNISAWEKQAEYWIGKVADGALTDSGGFASGCAVSESGARIAYPSSLVVS